MKNFSRHFCFYITGLSLILFLSICKLYARQNKGGNTSRDHLKYAIFFTSGDVDRLLADSAAFQKTMDYFAPVKISKVYLEGRSGTDDINVSLLKKLAEKFRAIGIEAWGAMVPVSPQGGPSCYNNPEDMASLKKRMQGLAKVFDYIILDDWLFTTCVDEKSVKDRGEQSWADYRTALILKQSKKYIIDAAKEVNPKVKVIIKYPNWYEGHRQNGYDVYKETLQFDKMAVGIETRDPETQDQHIPVYSGYIFQKWWPAVDPSKWIGSWLDNYDMKGSENNYAAQVYQAVLAQTPEIILWCAGQLYPTNPSSDVYPHFKDLLPEFDKVAGSLKGSSRGVPIYLPYGSTGEYNIFGYLGMAGIPLAPTAKFPTESQNAIFTLNSLQDPKLADEMLSRLRKGHDIFMTWGLWLKLQKTEFKNAFSFAGSSRNTYDEVNSNSSVTSSEFHLREGWFSTQNVKADRPFTFPRIETTTWPYVRDVAVIKEDYDYAVLIHAQYMKGNIYVLNMPDNAYDLLQLPVPALNLIRRAFSKELGVELNAPGEVGLYLFGEKQYVLYNMGNKETSVSLRFTGNTPTTGWNELVHNESLSVQEDSSFTKFGAPKITNVSLSLKPFEIAVIQAP